MMIVPAGVKVHLALGYTDMRNYADPTIMPSPRLTGSSLACTRFG